MKHRTYEAGRRRRTLLLVAWVVAVLAIAVVVLANAPPVSQELTLASLLAFAAAILVPIHLVTKRNDEATDWYLHGRCLTCGFDLHLNDDRCPECGRPSGPLKL